MAELPTDSTWSGLVDVDAKSMYLSATGRVATVWEYRSGAFESVTTVRLDFNIAPSPVVAGDVTEDGDADFLVPIMGGDNAQGSIISSIDGDWHLAPFDGGSFPLSPTWVNLSISDGTLLSQENDCVPICA